MLTPARRAAVTCLLGCSTLALATLAFAQSMYKCTGADGRISYQQTPCAGTGKALDVTIPSGYQGGAAQGNAVPGAATASSGSANSADTGAPAGVPPVDPPLQARGRLNGWPKSGDGLVEGMAPRDVIRRWGRPHKVDIVEERGLFFDYCDARAAFFFDGKLTSWSALFPESKAGSSLFVYGEPWKVASLRWGIERDRRSFSNSASDRGDVQTWGKGKWIVTDAAGNITAWCESRGSSSMPPTLKTAWE